MVTPNKEHIKLWIDALRSGKYQQGTGALARRVAGTGVLTYCCLGVACEVASANGVMLTTRLDYDAISYGEDGESHPDGDLPPIVRDWLGLDSGNPMLINDGHTSCIRANDTLNWTFEQIADALEKLYIQETPDGNDHLG